MAAIEQIYATDELSVPLTILVDDKGIVKELIPGWSAETQRKLWHGKRSLNFQSRAAMQKISKV